MMNTHAVSILAQSVLAIPPWLYAIGFVSAWIGLVALVLHTETFRSLPATARRYIVAGDIALLISSSRVYALQFTPYYPCTSENWEWLLDNLYYIAALTVWYGAYGCF